MQVSNSPKQLLPSGPQALIKWAADHGYGPVTSYTNTPVANHFNIRLREPGKLKKHPQNDVVLKQINKKHGQVNNSLTFSSCSN